MAISQLKVKGNKKIIQTNIMAATNKVITLKDIHNLNSKLKAKTTGVTDLQALVTEIRKIQGATIEIAVSDDNELLGVHFQDQRMKQMFEHYPELVIYDATYKLNNLRMPIFLLLVVDGNGESEIISIWFVKSESHFVFTSMANIFKQQNPSYEAIEVFMADKDFADREAVKECFPGKYIGICIFHVLRTFKREITEAKRKITPPQKFAVMDILQKMVYSYDEDKYNEYYESLMSLNLK
ncbi:uncharacterized protein B4U80_07169, partial [Leptotrombidium deliense]